MKNRASGFTLLELLVVLGLVAALSGFFAARLGGGRAAALQSAQAVLANLVTAARTRAIASGQSARLLVCVDETVVAGEPLRFLRCVALQTQTSAGWQLAGETWLPEGIFILPGNFAAIPDGLFPAGAGAWTRSDGAALRSTALRASRITTETLGASPTAVRWAAISFSAFGGTAESGNLVVAAGRLRPPGSYRAGESPVELENPERVRGLSLSVYGVPALINARASF